MAKLTLSINERAIESGKQYASAQGRTLSPIVESYLETLGSIQSTSLAAPAQALMSIAHVAALDETIIHRGLSYGFKDTEDSFVVAIAEKEHANAIITNNVKSFTPSPVEAVAPAEYLARMDQCPASSMTA